MMDAPSASSCACVTALTVPCVPTGMKTGVSIVPCGVASTPRRARPSVCVSRKEKEDKDAIRNSDCGVRSAE